MRQAFIYDVATGETRQRMVSATIDMFNAIPIPEGQAVLIMDADIPILGDDESVIGFELQDHIETLETWLNAGQIEIRARTPVEADILFVARMKKRQQVASLRDTHEWAGAATPLGRMDSDPDSQRKVNGAASMAMIASSAGQAFSIDWTMQDNSTVTHDAAAMMAAGVAMGEHVAACHACAVALKMEVDAAADMAALDAIDIEAGWP